MKSLIFFFVLTFLSVSSFAEVSNSCKFNNHSISAVFNKAISSFSIRLVDGLKVIQELDVVKKFNEEKFELQCMDAKEASALKKSLSNSEGIHDFMKLPIDSGALCYFIDETTTKCWSQDVKTKSLVNIGGWQT